MTAAATTFSEDSIRPFLKNQGTSYRLDLFIRGVKCGHCVNKISNEVSRIKEIQNYEFESGGQRLSIWGSSETPFGDVISSISSLGFEAIPLTEISDQAEERRLYKSSLKKLAVAGVCAGNIMLFSTAIYLGADEAFKLFFHKMSFVLLIPTFFYSASSIWYGSWQAIRHQKFNLDFPIGLALVLGAALSLVSFFTGGEAIYFDSLAVVIFLILASRFVLNRYVNSIYENNIIHFVPGVYQARRLSADGESMVSLAALKKGDCLKVIRSEAIPVDGRLLSEDALVDRSVLTGESDPQTLKKGDRVHAGTQLVFGEALVEVERVGSSTRVGRYIAHALKNQKKEESESFALVSAFTFFVVAASALTFMSLFFTAGLAVAFERAFAIVLVACPCAVSFGIPLIRSFTGQLALKNGMVLKDPKVLKKLANIKNLYFDKTGTLTEFRVKINSSDFSQLTEQDQIKVLSLELSMDHPISHGFMDLLPEGVGLEKVSHFRYEPGTGLSGEVGGDRLQVISGQGSEKTLRVIKNHEEIGQLRVSTGIKKEINGLFAQLAHLGLKISVLSGDQQSQVNQIRDLVPESARGVFLGELTPEEKLGQVSQDEGNLMVGDGINDLAAMQGADLSVCMPGALENNMKVADVTLTRGHLDTITGLFSLAHRVHTTEKGLFVFTGIYNSICVGLAIMGYITPVAAAILMPISSVSVLTWVLIRLGRR